MKYVIAACADQAEAIYSALDEKAYRLYDILPGGEPDYTKDQYAKLLACGDTPSLSRLPMASVKLRDAIERSTHGTETTVFGQLVQVPPCFYVISASFI
jgi:hypothetical protein